MQPSMHRWDGILGLGFPPLSSSGSLFFQNMRSSGVAPIFSFIPTDQGQGAQLLIGEDAYRNFVEPNTVVWLNSVSTDFWRIDARVGIYHHVPRRFLVDTGTSLIMLPPDDFISFVRSLVASGATGGGHCELDTESAIVYCPCQDVARMPPVKFYLDPYSDDTPFVLGANDIFEPLSEARDVCILLFSVAPVDAGGTWILGDTFLRKFAVMFDFTHHRVGFAVRAFSQSLSLSGKSDAAQINVSTVVS